MAMLLIGPFLPWFHTELIMPQTGLSGVPGKPVRRSWNWIDLPFPGFERERRGHQDVYCGAGLPGLFIAGLASMNGRMSLDWTDARFVLDAGYYVTPAGYIVALAGNRLIALARRKIE
jgi:hypothetical protein